MGNEGEEAEGGREEERIGGESCQGVRAEKDGQREKREGSRGL